VKKLISRQTLLRTKPVELSLQEAQTANPKGLARTLGTVDLTALGVGAIIGTGIFVLTGVAAANFAGPAVIISFVVSGLAAGLAALCYAELAASVPVAGSAYTYTYSSLGEFVAWLVGWNLILEYLVSAAAVAVGWSGYFCDMLKSVGVPVSPYLTLSPWDGGWFNLPAIIITLLITWIVLRGSRESAQATKFIVLIKLAVVVLFILVGMFHIDTANWKPFAPFGFSGIMAGAAIVFFAYIGFDAVATAAEEVKDPKRSLPRGIIASLGISTVLYILVAGILTGMLKYTYLNSPSPISSALLAVGIRWASAFISVGALAGLTSVLIAVIFAQSRIFFAMARDGLLPPVFATVHRKYKTPHVNILLIGTAICLIAAFFPVRIIAEMANIGTLSALAVVSLGVIILRKTKPQLERPFKVPWVPVIPAAAVIACLYLMLNLPAATWIRLVIWLTAGIVVYFLYGVDHSILRSPENRLTNFGQAKKEKPFRFRWGRI
jgi:APA family basic amino acid/polyamine antiporter